MIGMTSVTFRNKNAEEIVDLCQKCSIECIEWGGDIHVPPNDLKNAEKIGELTRNSGISVSSYGSYFKVGKDSFEDFKNVLDTAKKLKAPVIRVWCGEKGSEHTEDETFDLYVNQLKAMCGLSKEHNIIIACEFHNKTYNDTAKSALKLLKEVDCDNFKTYWQTLYYNETDLTDIKELRENIVNVHVFSWNKSGKRYSLKKNLKLWKNYVELSRASNPNYIIEFVKHDSEKNFKKDVLTLKKLLG